MAPALLRARAPRSTLSYGLFAGALALLMPSSALAVATSVVTCRPSAGSAPTVKLSPALVPPPDAAKYGYKLATTIDGCVANAQQLSDWNDVKRGTPDGARIAQADVTLALTGVNNCVLGLFTPPAPAPDAYEAVGKLQLKWLDANGDKIKTAKTTTAFIHLTPLTQTFFGLSSYGEGVVTNGLGVGASVKVTLPIPMSFLTAQQGDFTYCVIGGIPTGPGDPGFAPRPLKAIPLSARPVVEIVFPDPISN